jgi:hypothetical protein
MIASLDFCQEPPNVPHFPHQPISHSEPVCSFKTNHTMSLPCSSSQHFSIGPKIKTKILSQASKVTPHQAFFYLTHLSPTILLPVLHSCPFCLCCGTTKMGYLSQTCLPSGCLRPARLRNLISEKSSLQTRELPQGLLQCHLSFLHRWKLLNLRSNVWLKSFILVCEWQIVITPATHPLPARENLSKAPARNKFLGKRVQSMF